LTSSEAAAIDAKTSSPSYTEDIALWLEPFLTPSFPGGLYHLCNSGSCSWRDYGAYALECAKRYGIPVLTTHVAPLTLAKMTSFVALRPPHSSLDTSKFTRVTGIQPRSWKEALEEYFPKSLSEN
jgi:dTDP-4-dehydrorhamnose reductase